MRRRSNRTTYMLRRHARALTKVQSHFVSFFFRIQDLSLVRPYVPRMFILELIGGRDVFDATGRAATRRHDLRGAAPKVRQISERRASSARNLVGPVSGCVRPNLGVFVVPTCWLVSATVGLDSTKFENWIRPDFARLRATLGRISPFWGSVRKLGSSRRLVTTKQRLVPCDQSRVGLDQHMAGFDGFQTRFD